jgi:DNA gyrase subunit A
MGRATQGVRLINLKDDDGIAAVAKVECELVEPEDAEITDDVVTSEIDGEDESSEDNSTTEKNEE